MPSRSPSPQAGRGSGRGADEVDLTGLEIIRRYSLAVRQATAGRAEVVATLRADLDRLERPTSRDSAPARRPAPRGAQQAPARRSGAGRTPADPAADG